MELSPGLSDLEPQPCPWHGPAQLFVNLERGETNRQPQKCIMCSLPALVAQRGSHRLLGNPSSGGQMSIWCEQGRKDTAGDGEVSCSKVKHSGKGAPLCLELGEHESWEDRGRALEEARPGSSTSSMRAVCRAGSWPSFEDSGEHWRIFRRRSDAKNSASVHQCWIKSWRQSSGWNRKE